MKNHKMTPFAAAAALLALTGAAWAAVSPQEAKVAVMALVDPEVAEILGAA